jgi:glycosyltransferase involved in cell wall biosynthesis
LIQADVRADRGEGLVVVNDQAGELGGTERVLGALLDRYPDARLLALRFSSTNASGHDPLPWPNRRCLIEAGRRRYHFAAPLYARRIARAPIGAATVVLTLPASGGWSLAAAIPPGARHVAYVAGLSRPFFARTSDYLRNYPPAVRPLLRAAGPALRAHNRRLARRPDRLLTNSSAGAATFERTYGRRATVIHPPVMTDYFTPAPVAPRHHLIVARMVPHKRVEVAINAFRGLDERLLVVGDGPWLTRLRAHAPANVEFTGFVADRRLRELYRASRAVICPSEEEFGLVMAEALACGVPVIAPRAGGALEIVRNGLTGVLLEQIDSHSIARAVEALRVRHIDPSACRASVLRFDIRHFLRAIEQVLAEERERAAPSSAVQQPPAGARVSAPVPSPAFVAPRSE